MIFNSNKKDINSHDVLADLFEGKNVKQAMKAAKSVSFDSEIEKFLAEALICLREITGEKNPVFCDRKINSKNGDILLNRAFDWFETARKSAKTGSDEEMSLVREIMFSEYVLNCFIMGASENKGCCLYSIVDGINSRQQGDQQSFDDSFFEKAFAGAGDAGVSEEILRAYREELRDATAVSNSQGAAEVKTVTENQRGGKDSSEAKMIFEEDCFQNGNNLSTAQNTTIAATDRNNTEKDASDKSAPQAEFKRIEYDGGDVYEGETRNGKRHGKGKYTWSDGSFYDGEWKDGKKDGNGKQSHPDGSCYDGGWKDDKMDGFGVLVYSNQSRYEGHWSEGNENGHGMLTFANGNSYDGEWKDGNENGHGIKKYINVGVYDGEWKDGDENGHGIMKYINGDVYDGEWKDGYENGHGTMTFANGDSYDGDWVNGEMNGNGIYTYANGEKYKVTCKEDEIISKEPFETPKTSSTVIRSNQKAKIEYKQIRYDSGDVYEGETQNGKRHGKGKYTWADGDTYEGDWKDGERCGRGKVIQYGKVPATGETYVKRSYDGEWLDSKEHGHGICVEGDFGMYKNDKVYEGEWVNGKRQGRFVWYLTNSKGGRYMDFYEDGNLIETCIPYDESIKTIEDARRARALADGKSSSTTPVYTNSSPAAAQDSADTAEDFEWEEFSSVGELHEKILRPELFCDPRDRYLLNSCMYLEPFVDEFHEEFSGGDYAETKEIIAEILGVKSDELTESIERRLDFIRGFTEKEYLLAAMYSLAYDERTDLAPYLANLACYLWTDTRDGDYLDPLLDLFRLSGEYDDDDSTWLCAILRLQENGNIDDPLKPNDDGSFDDQFADFDDVFGDLLDQGYLPGADGKMYLSDSDDNGGDETEESDTGDNVLLRYQNGDSYRGAAVGGVREGFGTYFFADGGFYRGCFHADNYEGYGMLDEGNGRVYKGLWKDDKRCGYGEQTLESGSKYFGWWKDNVYHGFGRFVFASGSENVGEFKNGKENGIFLIKRDGEWYGYKWVDGEIIPSLDGALITYNDGSGYVGQTVTENHRGLAVRIRQGYGEYRFPGNSRNGSTNIYQGQFSQDVPYGTGIRVDTTGEKPVILASDDFRGDSIPDGKCRAVRLTGVDSYEYALFYEGGYRDGGAFGSGMLYVVGDSENDHYRYRPYGLPIGSIVRCDHFDGGPTGAAIVTDEYGEMRYGRFVDGFWEPNK